MNRLLSRTMLLWACLGLFACESDDPPVTDAGMADRMLPPGWDGLCDARIEFQTTASTPRVFAAGEWNEFAEAEDELVDDGTGNYAVTLRLAPGLYGYKLVVNDGAEDPYRLDPKNDFRVFVDDLENTGLRVPDCSLPRITLSNVEPTDDGIRASLSVNGLAEIPSVVAMIRHQGSDRMLTSEELSRVGDALTLSVNGLADGKHTVVVVATDSLGNESESLLLPFWVEDEPFEWRDAVIYMVMTDRFKNGEPGNDRVVEAAPGAGFMGGDFQGLQQAIEDGYFDDLGINALWLTPFNQNPEGTYIDSQDRYQVSGYHGYWPTDPLEVEERLGGAAALRQLIDAAHARGIRVLMDWVVNHVHEDHPYVARHPNWFNTGCVCGTDGCDWTARRLDCLFRPYMPDVNFRNREASEQFASDALAWVEDFDLDGLRIDAVKHVDDLAVFNLGTLIRERFETAGTKYFLMGETAMGWDSSSGPTEGGNRENYDTISRYIGPNALDGQFDFPLYYAASLQFLNDEPGRGMAHIDFWTQASQARYPEGAIMTPYIGSHDVPRFVTLSAHPAQAGNQWEDLPPSPPDALAYDRMYLALGWLMALPGAPLLYYGDEYGEFGASDPDNRHPMRFADSLSPIERAQHERVTELVQARRALPGFRSTRWESRLATETLLVVERGEGDEAALLLINAGPSPETASFASELGALRDVLSDESFSGTDLEVPMPGRSVRYLAQAR